MTDLPVHPAVRESLARWHRMIAEADLHAVAELLHPDATFRSPTFWRPYPGAHRVAHILQTVITLFEGFTYHREMTSADGRQVVLEFSATIDELDLKGVDIIGFDIDGKIVDFEVMIRPKKSLGVLAERMAAAVDLAILA